MKSRMSHTIEEIRRWPAAVELVTAAEVFGIGRTSAYEMARDGTFPARVVRVDGRGRYVVSTASILAVLGASDELAAVPAVDPPCVASTAVAVEEVPST